ncbi:MAG: ABC transporter substrate-binding protein [Lachnospiraceae bacterium]|nr:ABC transporter substrate-binding protein [Lachnospiraceae bacterium]
MRQRSLFVRLAAFFMAVVLAMAMTGCNGNNSLDGEHGTFTDGMNEASGQGNSADSNGMGRYVGTTVYEGKECYGLTQMQTLNDGRIMLLNPSAMEKSVSTDGGSTWNIEADETLSAFMEEHYPAAAAVAKDGTVAFIGLDEREDSPGGFYSEYDCNLYICSTDDTIRQLPVELPEEDARMRNLAFDEAGNLYVYVYAAGSGSIYVIDIHEGTAEKLVQVDNSNETMMECRDNLLMYVTARTIFLYDLEKKSFVEDETLERFLEENYESGMLWVGGNYHAYAFLGEGCTIYIVDEKGLYRHTIGGSVVEQVIDGAFSPLGNPTDHIVAMTTAEENNFLAMFDNGKMIKFVYDAALPSVPTDRLIVYSLKEDDLVKQTIAACQAQAPNLYIQYQIGMSEEGITREDALKKLNTQLLSGSGPDIIMLDGMNMDTYAEKGVLADLSDIVREVSQQDGLYSNLIDELAVDNRIYAVPAKFYIPVLYGDETFVGGVEDYESLADMVERARESYPDTDLLNVCSATGILRRSVPVCAPSWKDDDGHLNQDKIRAFLEQTKQIYEAQMHGTPQSDIEKYQQDRFWDDGTDFEDNGYFMSTQGSAYLMRESPFAYGEILTASNYEDVLSVSRMEGLENTMIKLLDGQSSKVYHPASIIGMNAAAENSQTARQFVKMMLGNDVQKLMQFGLPVNKKALTEQFACKESDLGENGEKGLSGFTMTNGETFLYLIYPVDEDDIARLEQWIACFDTPYLGDAVLENIVYTEGVAYLEGMQELDAAVSAIADSVEIYLYE